MHNGYFAETNPIRHCWNIIGNSAHVGADYETVLAKKNPFDQLFVKGNLVLFFVKVFIVWPWENIGASGASIGSGVHCQPVVWASIDFW